MTNNIFSPAESEPRMLLRSRSDGTSARPAVTASPGPPDFSGLPATLIVPAITNAAAEESFQEFRAAGTYQAEDATTSPV